jgi:hypothetical protein
MAERFSTAREFRGAVENGFSTVEKFSTGGRMASQKVERLFHISTGATLIAILPDLN